MNGRHSHRVSLVASWIATGYLLVRFAPDPARLRSELAAPHAWCDRVGSDAALAALAGALLWLAALWLAAGLAATLLGVLPGPAGGLARAIAGRTVPAALRRAILAAAGASLVISPLTCTPAVAAGGIASQPTIASQPAPGWPADPPAPSWPLDPAEPARPAEPAEPVIVRPGQSLWTITADQLGPRATNSQISLEWPYWYRANRAAIGADPNLLRPGTELIAPSGRTGSASSMGG